MKTKTLILMAGALCFSAASQAQVSGVVGSLTGSQGAPATNALGGLGATSAPLLDGLNLNGGGLSDLSAPLTSPLTNALPANSLDSVFSNPTVLPRPDSLFDAPTSQKLVGDLPAGFMISASQLSPSMLQSVLDDAAIALPAGALPIGTMIPVASLDGLDPSLANAVSNNQIAANLLPEDLPIHSSVLDPTLVSQVLRNGVPAALLPKAMPIEVGQLSGL